MRHLIELAEEGRLSDRLIRWGIRWLNRERLRVERRGDRELQQEAKRRCAVRRRRGPLGLEVHKPDQGTGQGVSVLFFGRVAFTTPVPAMLAVIGHRPIVLVACYRPYDSRTLEGAGSDPIWPGEYSSEIEEIHRLTRRMNLEMEAIIRKYPEQYFWMQVHSKKYKRRRKFLA